MANSVIQSIDLNQGDADIAVSLTVFFTGGPISVVVQNDAGIQTYSFTADVFLRRSDRYVASGAVIVPTNKLPAGEFRNSATVLFANAIGAPATYRVELISPRRPAALFVSSGVVAANDSQSIVLAFDR
jgi:hypothetical protein